MAAPTITGGSTNPQLEATHASGSTLRRPWSTSNRSTPVTRTRQNDLLALAQQPLTLRGSDPLPVPWRLVSLMLITSPRVWITARRRGSRPRRRGRAGPGAAPGPRDTGAGEVLLVSGSSFTSRVARVHGQMHLVATFVNGGSSLTGLEAISNGVSAFRKPEGTNARRALVVMSCTLGCLGRSDVADLPHARISYGNDRAMHRVSSVVRASGDRQRPSAVRDNPRVI